jgi:nucleotide-binding universal stress UspA family protein
MPKLFRRILHPSDFSRASAPAFARALELARSSRAELILLHVIDGVIPLGPDGYVSPSTWEQIQKSSRQYARRGLDRLLARAARAGVKARVVVAEGSAPQQIARVARARGADLIVMGTHGRGALAKFFLGSVAERVIATAGCPVLTVRARGGR